MANKKITTDMERLCHLLMTKEARNLNEALDQYYRTLSKCYPTFSTDFKINDMLGMMHSLLLLIARDYEWEQRDIKPKEEE